MQFENHTVTIDGAGVHVRRDHSKRGFLKNFVSSSIDAFDAALTDFRGVRVRGTYDVFGCEGVFIRSRSVNVMLIHKHSKKDNVLLAEGDWDIDFHKFSDQSFEALKQLSADAGCALSLPVLEEGILSENDLRKAQAAA